MRLENINWLLKGLTGLINLLERYIESRGPLNTTAVQELKQCRERMQSLEAPAIQLNQDLDQGARNRPEESSALTNESQSTEQDDF